MLVSGSLLPAVTEAERQPSLSAVPSGWTMHPKSSADTWNAKKKNKKRTKVQDKGQLINSIQFEFIKVKKGRWLQNTRETKDYIMQQKLFFNATSAYLGTTNVFLFFNSICAQFSNVHQAVTS